MCYPFCPGFPSGLFSSLAEPWGCWWLGALPAEALMSLPNLAHQGGNVSASLQAVAPEVGSAPAPAWLTHLGVPEGGQMPHKELQGCPWLPPNLAKEAGKLTELRARQSTHLWVYAADLTSEFLTHLAGLLVQSISSSRVGAAFSVLWFYIKDFCD